MASSHSRRLAWFGLNRLIGALILANALVADGATILFEFANRRQVGFPASVTFRSPIHGPESQDPTLIINGQSAEGMPSGTAVYAGPRLDGTGYTAELLFGETQDNLAPVADSRTPFLSGSNAGYWVPKRVDLPAIEAGVPYYVQARVWENRQGLVDSWDKVLADSSVLRGESPVRMTHNPGVGSNGQLFLPDYTLWESFNIHTGSDSNVLPLLDLSRAQSGRELVLTWTGKLETADSPFGPWTTVPEVISPVVIEPSEPRRYYRSRLP